MWRKKSEWGEQFVEGADFCGGATPSVTVDTSPGFRNSLWCVTLLDLVTKRGSSSSLLCCRAFQFPWGSWEQQRWMLLLWLEKFLQPTQFHLLESSVLQASLFHSQSATREQKVNLGKETIFIRDVWYPYPTATTTTQKGPILAPGLSTCSTYLVHWALLCWPASPESLFLKECGLRLSVGADVT